MESEEFRNQRQRVPSTILVTVERLFGTVFGNRIEAVACRTGVSVPRRFRFRRDGRTEEGDFADENHQADRERTPGSGICRLGTRASLARSFLGTGFLLSAPSGTSLTEEGRGA